MPEAGTARPFGTSLAAQRAARIVIETARKNGLWDGGAIAVDPALAGMEKALFAGMFHAVAKRGGAELSAEEFSAMFHFVFAKAAEAAVSCWSKRPFETDVQGLFDGNIPFYANDELGEFFKAQRFPVECAQNCWDSFRSGAGSDPLLSLFEALKWCFRFGCHAGIAFLERLNPDGT